MKILIFLLLSFSAWSQVYLPVPQLSFDQNPNHVEWRKIDTTHFELIFPKEVEASAQVVAKILESSYPLVSKSLKVSPPKISILLQTKTLDSNGFVTLAPRRSEFFLSPSLEPEMTNTEWLTTLGIHEFRHVVQFEKINQGFTRVFYTLLGEIGQALGLAFTTPPWFLEGDAVGIETALTQGGRGRLPQFERELKALSLHHDYKLDQLLFGSYDFYAPSHYVYGYFFTSFLREELGEDYSTLIDRSADRSYNPLSFYYRADEMLGGFDEFVKNKMKEMISFWRNQSFTPMKSELISPSVREGWTNYFYPQHISDNKFFALKQGLGDINHFVTLENGKEKIVYFPAPFVARYPIKLRNERFSIVEKQFHPRWGLEDFSILRVLDLKGQTLFVKEDLKWRIAVIDHNGAKVAGLLWTDRQEQRLAVIELETKNEVEFLLPSSIVITSLDWIDEETLVFIGKDQESQKGIYTYDLRTSTLLKVYSAGFDNLGFVTSEEGLSLIHI